MKVLYVEDDFRDADLTLRTLQKTAPHITFEMVSTVGAAVARLERISTEPLDLVLTDMNLRNGSGLTLLNHIRENSLPVAVVVVTGMGDEDTAVAALKAHADDYVVKRKEYLDRLPLTLESAFSHYKADAARRANPLKVLYADDDPIAVESTRRHLAVHADHIQIDVATNASDALQLLRPAEDTHTYDVVLLNFQLRESNALEVLRELRHTSKRHTPVVLVCSEQDEELARQGLKLGASGCLVKRPGYLYQLPWELEQAHSRAELSRRESALRESEARRRLAQQAARVGTWEWDLQTGESVWSEMIWELVGLKPGDKRATLDTFVEFIHPEDREPAVRKAYEVIAKGEDYYGEFRLVRADGSVIWVSSKGRVIRSVDGHAERMIGVNVDITELKLAEESLKSALSEVQQLKDRLHEENIYLQEEVRVASNFGEIIGHSESLKRVLQEAEQVAPLNTTVLVLGETGTGKELLAHAIHRLSPRRDHPLVKVNCAALPAPLIESELFGHEKGAFTGADARHMGRFEIAQGGTIFLDEVGELPLDLQTKLLRVLEEGELERVGGTKTINVDVRVIAATNRNLEQAVRKGSFRSDLYYRLNIFPITLPPLRERREDIATLAKHFVREIGQKLGKEVDAIPQDTMAILRNYPWPGNIRELRNVIERAVIITQGTKLRLSDTFDSSVFDLEHDQREGLFDHVPGIDVSSETLEQNEYNLILRTLNKVHWKLEGPGGAAALLDIHPSTLRSRMRKLGIERPKVKAHSQETAG